MRSELDVLLDKVADPTLRANIRWQVDRLRAKKTFGLVFESHLPERVRLPEHEIRVGVRVTYRDDPASAAFEVKALKKGIATLRKVRNSDGSVLSPAQQAEVLDETARLNALVVIADFGEPVFPGLRRLESIARGGDKPAHAVIKGENHHVLEALQFTHAGKIDCIYIDPPYNTGARDWKYDNNYVDETDAYRHSKWLAFMERRLRLAKELLNRDSSVLICTIDEKEYLRLGLLLEQVFPGARTQMISITISPRGTSRSNEFSRVDEYAFIVYLGDVELAHSTSDSGRPQQARWQYLRRDERTSTRAAGRPNQFFPIYITDSGQIEHVGEPLPPGVNRSTIAPRLGSTPVFPVREDGTEMVWGLTAPALRRILADGFVRVSAGSNPHQPWNITYLRGIYKNLASGKLEVVGEREDGSKIVVVPGGKVSRPATVWRDKAHDAGAYGTSLLGAFVPGRHFPFPKSLYAVEDLIRYFVKAKPEAVVLDFFAGSGTTAHAVARLNRQDGGRRQSISVTNNEVSADEAKTLRKKGFRPGDPEWEAVGIFEHITRPRITAAMTGRTPDGDPVAGEYKFIDEFLMAEGFEENVEFFELTYLDPEVVELDKAFYAIAPLLWLRAGARGPIIDECLDAADRRRPYAWTEKYGVLFNPDRWRSFVRQCRDSVSTVFIVTDSQTTFAGVASELPDGLDIVRLYENYLSTFAINRGYL